MGDTHVISSQPQELDEDEEALSFCDIPLYSDASADNSFVTSLKEDSFFEFFRTRSPDSIFQPDHNFVFCGRVIPYEDSSSQKKVSRGSTIKSCRWHKIMFGSMRLSAEMELADIKSRQRRRRKHKALLGMYGNDERSNSGRRSSTNVLMRLIRSLSCRGRTSTSILHT